jgi:hypothetical protein
MTQVIEKLKAKLTGTSGKLIRGSVSRTAEILEISPGTVANWLSGKSKPNRRWKKGIEEMLAIDFDLRSKRTGPRGPWKKFPVANVVVVEELTPEPEPALQANEII